MKWSAHTVTNLHTKRSRTARQAQTEASTCGQPQNFALLLVRVTDRIEIGFFQERDDQGRTTERSWFGSSVSDYNQNCCWSCNCARRRRRENQCRFIPTVSSPSKPFDFLQARAPSGQADDSRRSPVSLCVTLPPLETTGTMRPMQKRKGNDSDGPLPRRFHFFKRPDCRKAICVRPHCWY